MPRGPIVTQGLGVRFGSNFIIFHSARLGLREPMTKGTKNPPPLAAVGLVRKDFAKSELPTTALGNSPHGKTLVP